MLTYGSVMSCWAKAAQIASEHGNVQKAVEAAENTEELFRTMDVQPNTFSYNIVLTAWSRVAQISSAEAANQAVDRSESFLLDVVLPRQQKRRQSNSIKNNKNNNSVVKKPMRGRASSDKSDKPDALTFRLVIRAIDTSQVVDKKERASKILELMREHGIQPGVKEWKILNRLGVY